jgi:hypothetical protein
MTDIQVASVAEEPLLPTSSIARTSYVVAIFARIVKVFGLDAFVDPNI